jgi:hypothetical protein
MMLGAGAKPKRDICATAVRNDVIPVFMGNLLSDAEGPPLRPLAALDLRG